MKSIPVTGELEWNDLFVSRMSPGASFTVWVDCKGRFGEIVKTDNLAGRQTITEMRFLDKAAPSLLHSPQTYAE